jgi:hypothetical protein
MWTVTRPAGGIRLYASRHVKSGDVRVAGDRHAQDGASRYRMSADMTHLIIIDASTYRECIQRLQEMWMAEDRHVAEIAERRKELGMNG